MISFSENLLSPSYLKEKCADVYGQCKVHGFMHMHVEDQQGIV